MSREVGFWGWSMNHMVCPFGNIFAMGGRSSLNSSNLKWAMVFVFAFWHDPWCVVVTLKEDFPEVSRIARDKEAFVVDYVRWNNGAIHWDFLFTRPVHNLEVESLQSFLDLLYSNKINRDGESQICWDSN